MRDSKGQNLMEYVLLATAVILVSIYFLTNGSMSQSVSSSLGSIVKEIDNVNGEIQFNSSVTPAQSQTPTKADTPNQPSTPPVTPPPCVSSCSGKKCGQDDGCGSQCRVQTCSWPQRCMSSPDNSQAKCCVFGVCVWQ
ncbi:MAG: hypothetical protein HQL12_05340 [Candidatus Omnitrophica bacterium]|nr:hypothetical protein [Candidatus Omnitrophota bacterium]